MPMLCPSVPIDKNKQGGRNFDASKSTDFKKIGTISKTDISKVPGINNNRNQQTNTDEQRRASVLITGLRTIPRAYCPVCPTVAKRPDVLNDALPSETIANLTGITFYILYYKDTTYNLSYLNNFLYTNPPTNTYLLTNANVESGFWKDYNISIDSVGALPTNASRQDIVNALNAKLTIHGWPTTTPTANLVASITPNGNLVLSVSGTALTSGQLAGLFFGNAPSNGSTSLGVTNQNGVTGVSGAALMVASGQGSVIAPYRIADF